MLTPREPVRPMNVRAWLREPLTHFLIAGAALFAFFAWQGAPVDPTSRSITISREDRARLSLQWQQTMQRPPTDAELDSLTEKWLREEVLYREALRLGLDQGDAVVRKRMANKMDFLAGSIAETAQPSEQTLADWLANNPQRFASDPRYSFDQVYYEGKQAAQETLSKMGPQADGKGLGEPISLPARLDDAPTAQIAGVFGTVFADRLADVSPTGEWTGPIPSGFGWHLVRVRRIRTGKVPPLAQIRDHVEADWHAKTLESRKNKAYQLLRDAYDVTIER